MKTVYSKHNEQHVPHCISSHTLAGSHMNVQLDTTSHAHGHTDSLSTHTEASAKVTQYKAIRGMHNKFSGL